MYKGVLNRDEITRCGSMLLVFPLSVDHCPRGDFAFWDGLVCFKELHNEQEDY